MKLSHDSVQAKVWEASGWSMFFLKDGHHVKKKEHLIFKSGCFLTIEAVTTCLSVWMR